ncbi:MAG: ATP-binding cassette domain-containing protein [Mariprofundaceae bacterium]
MATDTNSYVLSIEREDAMMSVQSGDVVLLTGAIGSGKTHFLNQLAGLADMPAGSRMSLDGKPWPNKSSSRQLRMYFDRYPPLWMAQYVSEELVFGVRPRPTMEALKEALTRWRLNNIGLDTDTQYLNRLQALRLSLASMEIAQPLLALVDNPTDSLSEADAALLRDDMLTWAKRSRCIVVVSCNRWQDWHPWVQHIWHIPSCGAWPVPEAELD